MQHLVQIRHFSLVRFLVRELDPELFRDACKRENFLADQLARLIILRGNTALDEDTRIGLHHRCVFLVIAREYDDFHTADEVLECEKCHCLVILCIFDFFIRDNAADNLFRPVGDGWETRLLIRLEVCRYRGNVLPPALLLLLERMTADVDAEHLFFERQKITLFVFSDIRVHRFIRPFGRLVYEVKQTHLAA